MSTQLQKGPPSSLLWTTSWSIREYDSSLIPQFLVAGGMQMTDLACREMLLSFEEQTPF